MTWFWIIKYIISIGISRNTDFKSNFVWDYVAKAWKQPSGDMILLLLWVHICIGPAVEYWPIAGTCVFHSPSKLYNLCQPNGCCVLPRLSHPPHIYAGPKLMHSVKRIVKSVKNQPLSTSQIRCVKANKHCFAK